MTPIGDVEVLDGSRALEKPVVIIEAATAREALRSGEIADLVKTGLDAMELSGRDVVYLEQQQ